MKALCFDHFGGPEVLCYADIADPQRQPGEVLVKSEAIGLNFADIYRRRGNYHLVGEPPYIAGYEAAGKVVEAGADSDFTVGQRVAFADSPRANAELVAVASDRLLPLPDAISCETAAAVLLQGLTAQYLCRDSRALHAGESVLVHAAAGGVGLLLVQIAKLHGARVIGVTSTAVKREHALAAGADEVVLYSDDWVAEARRFGFLPEGVDVVYDAVGSTLQQSLDAARIGGQVVFYGMAGGDPPLIDARQLMDKSKSVTGGDLWNVLKNASERRSRAAQLFDWILQGRLKVEIGACFTLADGATAHALLESRRSSGKILMVP
jgi:NADPH:quinone reductase